MKKTHKMNIGGFSFNVEDDAVKALEAYLDSIKDAYRDVEDEKELVGDIEERIGELLVERTTAERVVSINEVNAVKSVMGEFSRVEDAPSVEGSEEAKPRRRLYRDCDNKAIGGVCAGLAACFNLDVVIFRLGFVVLMIGGAILSEAAGWEWCSSISGFVFLAYIVLWICVPAARTVEQKCQMNGKPVSAQQFGAARPARAAETPRRAGSGIGQILLLILGIIMILNGLSSLVASACYEFIPKFILKFVEDEMVVENINTIFSTPVIVSMVLSTALWGIWNIFVGVILSFDLKAPKWRPGLLIFIAFVLSSLAMVFFFLRALLNLPLLYNL